MSDSDLGERGRGPRASALRHGVCVARVVGADDPEALGRVRVLVPPAGGRRSGGGGGGESVEVWARLATTIGSGSRGARLALDDEVLLAFEGGEPSRPFVVGALGAGRPPQVELPLSNPVQTILGVGGATLSFTAAADGSAVITLRTPAGLSIVLDDALASITVEDASGNRLRLDSTGFDLATSASLHFGASQVTVDAGMVRLNAGAVAVTGTLTVDTLIANSVVASSYTPGAGNIW